MADAQVGDVERREGAAGDEHDVAGQPQPLDQRVGVVGEELQLARLEVAVVDGLVELQDPERQQRREAHPGQADVRRPEADPRPLLRPALGRDQVAQAEQRQAEGEHAVDAHHRRVAVVGGQGRADLVVGDDRQVDEEAEDAGAEEVPEADGDEEHDRPAVRERRLRARLLGGAELQERPRLDGQEGERDAPRRPRRTRRAPCARPARRRSTGGASCRRRRRPSTGRCRGTRR